MPVAARLGLRARLSLRVPGIIWIILAAMFLYTMSVVTGKFEIKNPLSISRSTGGCSAY
jgi:lactate permease